MKIGFFTDRYLPLTDGVAFSVEDFRVELEKLGHEVYVFAPRPSLRYKETSKRVIRFPAVKGLFFDDYMTSFFFPPQVIRRLEKIKLDVVHFHTPSQVGLLGAQYALKSKIPLVTTYHTDLYEYAKHYPAVLPGSIALTMVARFITNASISDYRDSLSAIKPERNVDKWHQKIIQHGLTTMHNHCDLVIAPSLKMQRQLKLWKTKPPIAILPTGVDKITTTKQEIARMRRRYSFKPEDKVILFVGRIGTEKNIGLLLAAFEIVAKTNIQAKLVLIGRGDDLDRFRNQAAASVYADRIVFTDRIPRDQLGAFYEAATVFAFPSTADTQGLVINEAAHAGLPIVMIDRDVSEVVRDRENGLIARNSAKDLANKLLTILKDEPLAKAMGLRSIELAGEFSASKQASKLLGLYQETIERHRETSSKTQAR